MRAKSLMVQGTTSYAGKSFLVMALCKIFRDKGYRVAPFKSQNTSLNSFVTKGGGEIARAQALQALAAGIEPSVEMNPILIKPLADRRSQVVVRGKPFKDIDARSYYEDFAPLGIEITKEAYKELEKEHDLIIIEGAGSPAEINLYAHDLANMRVAEIADAPVILIADIDRGGAFASIYGTINLLKPRDRQRVKGIVINKFRGDPEILIPGLREIEQLVERPVLGVIPYIKNLRLPAEDSVSLDDFLPSGEADIAVIKFPRISNFTDFDPLIYDGARVRFVESREELGYPDAIILPGTKNTFQDLQWLRNKGLDKSIKSSRGIPIIGICGGFQMLGKHVIDESGLEGKLERRVEGLGLLDAETRFREYSKTTRRVKGRIIAEKGFFKGRKGEKIEGYEIHMGETSLGKGAEPVFDLNGRLEGAMNSSGKVFGTYLHGLFDIPTLRKAFWSSKRRSCNIKEIWLKEIERAACIVSENLDMKKVEELIINEL